MVDRCDSNTRYNHRRSSFTSSDRSGFWKQVLWRCRKVIQEDLVLMFENKIMIDHHYRTIIFHEFYQIICTWTPIPLQHKQFGYTVLIIYFHLIYIYLYGTCYKGHRIIYLSYGTTVFFIVLQYFLYGIQKLIPYKKYWLYRIAFLWYWISDLLVHCTTKFAIYKQMICVPYDNISTFVHVISLTIFNYIRIQSTFILALQYKYIVLKWCSTVYVE